MHKHAHMLACTHTRTHTRAHARTHAGTRHGAYYLAEVLRMASSAPASPATLKALGCKSSPPCLSPQTR